MYHGAILRRKKNHDEITLTLSSAAELLEKQILEHSFHVGLKIVKGNRKTKNLLDNFFPIFGGGQRTSKYGSNRNCKISKHPSKSLVFYHI